MNINEEMKLHKWAQDMAEQQNSGLSQAQWCKGDMRMIIFMMKMENLKRDQFVN